MRTTDERRFSISNDRSFPDLEPLYNAFREYLEIGQRIDLLNARVDVSYQFECGN